MGALLVQSVTIGTTRPAQGSGARAYVGSGEMQSIALFKAVEAVRGALGAQLCLSRGLQLSLEAGDALCLLLDQRTRIEALGRSGFRVVARPKGSSGQDHYLSDVGQLQAFLAGFVAGTLCGAEPRFEGDAPSINGSTCDEAAVRQ